MQPISATAAGRIAVLAQDCDATRSICHALADRFNQPDVILEDPPPRRTRISSRARRLGVVEAGGQALFVGLAVPLLRRSARRRIRLIEHRHGLRGDPLRYPTTAIASVNSRAARDVLARLEPDVVVVSGTRIIGPETLAAVDAPFLNMHAGITPLYRGVHGGYWALAEGRPELVGTTVHVVDKGLDSGPVVERRTFAVTAADSFATYPYLHTAHGLPHLLTAVEHALCGNLRTVSGLELPSQLRHHPTLWGYLVTRARTGVR